MIHSIDQLLAVAKTYALAENVKLSTVSHRAMGDTKKLDALDTGKKDIWTRRVLSTMQWFSDHWPPNAEWPADIPRPARAAPVSQPEHAA